MNKSRCSSATPFLLAWLAAFLCASSACSPASDADPSAASERPTAASAPAETERTPPAETGAATFDEVAADAAHAPDSAGAEHADHADHDHAAAATPAAAPADETAGPVGRIETDTREHDFGSAIEGEVLSHTFKLKNVGEGPLRITQAKPTCGCTVGRLVVQDAAGEWVAYEMNDPIPPGTDFELEAKLNTRNKHNLAQSKINVFSNDPRGVIDLGLKATVSTYFRIQPPSIDFGDMSVSDAGERSFEVSTKKDIPFALEIEDRPVPTGMAVDLEPVSPDADGRALTWKVTVKVGEGVREGRIGYPINLLSDQLIEGAAPQPDGTPTVYTTTVMVNAMVKGLISYQPQYLSFGLVKPGQIQTRQLRIETNDAAFTFPPAKARIEAPTGEPSPFEQYFTYAVRPSVDGKALDVELTLNGMPADTNQPFQGKLIVETGHASMPEVSVLFSGICRVQAPVGTEKITVKPGEAQGGEH